MRTMPPLPHLAVLAVLTSGGPYRIGDVVSLAFVESTVGRLVSHGDATSVYEAPEAALVPESISARVIRAAGPYRVGATLTLSFVDPTIARIFEYNAGNEDAAPQVVLPLPRSDAPIPADAAPAYVTPTYARPAHTALLATATVADASVFAAQAVSAPVVADNTAPIVSYAPAQAETTRDEEAPARSFARSGGVTVHLQWTSERVRRFVTVVDKLFTVERLGWYRHVLAMRLLVPDRIACGDSASELEAMRHVHALRAASVETLGRPMLAAFMPNFTVTPDWLESIDSPAAARALAGIREAIEPFVTDDAHGDAEPIDDTWTVGRVVRDDLSRAPASVESLMPVLIASFGNHPDLRARLVAYRRTLIDVFAQTAQSAEAVRLGAMTQPNHSLDDRLWQLVGTLGETFGDAVVA